MLNIFNRRELMVTMDMKRQGEVRNILASNGIEYDIKVTNLESPAMMGNPRARTGSMGINQKQTYEYKIYVHKKDYDEAEWLISALIKKKQ